jgi:hypothetical protein
VQLRQNAGVIATFAGLIFVQIFYEIAVLLVNFSNSIKG